LKEPLWGRGSVDVKQMSWRSDLDALTSLAWEEEKETAQAFAKLIRMAEASGLKVGVWTYHERGYMGAKGRYVGGSSNYHDWGLQLGNGVEAVFDVTVQGKFVVGGTMKSRFGKAVQQALDHLGTQKEVTG
jgi:hypothetical protein